MKKNLVNVLTTENEVNEERKEQYALCRDLSQVSEKAMEMGLSFDEKSQEIRKVYKEHGFGTKEINQKIRDREDSYMSEQTKNEVAVFRNGKVVVSFTPEEFNYLDDLIFDVFAMSKESLNEIRKDEEQLQGRAWGSLTEMIELDAENLDRDRETRYKKRLAKSVLDKINFEVREENGLYLIEQFYNFRHNSAIKII